MRTTKLLLLIGFSATAIEACSRSAAPSTSTRPTSSARDVTVDARDGRSYQIVRIGAQRWLSQNMRFASPRSRCYDDQTAQCERLGRLYDWREALTACPAGWRLASDDDWKALEREVGVPADSLDANDARGESAGDRLKRSGNTGFNAELGGWFDPQSGRFRRADTSSALWTATESSPGRAWHRDVGNLRTSIWRSPVPVDFLLSARCVEGPSPTTADSTQPNYAIQQAYRDSVERTRVGQFIAEYQRRARPFHETGNYLGEMQLARQLATQLGDSGGVRDMATQQIATFASFLGDPSEAIRLFDSLGDDVPPSQVDTARLARLRIADAVETITAAADSARVIFVNEAHHVPQTRLLTLALLAPLRAKGFTHLAAETLSPFDSSLNARAYPVHATGYYSNEPLFGEILREARRLGYVLVPYEAIGNSSQDERETGQATNLRDRIFRERPHARVLVHAGYSHINESGTLGGAKPMAIRFRELTGIDPLTVDQTAMYEHSTRSREHPIYRHIVDRTARQAPFVLIEDTGRPWTLRPGTHDMTVFLPRVRLQDGRPDWLWRTGNRRPYVVRGSLCTRGEICIATARLSSESANAVPRDAVLISPNDASKALALPAGQYRITVRDTNGAALADTTVAIR